MHASCFATSKIFRVLTSGARDGTVGAPALRDRLVEVRGPQGDMLYMSPNLSQPVRKNRIETFNTRHIGERAVRIGVFRDQELTLHVGAELKEIEQLGWKLRAAW